MKRKASQPMMFNARPFSRRVGLFVPVLCALIALPAMAARDAACEALIAELDALKAKVDVYVREMAACKGNAACVIPLRDELYKLDGAIGAKMREYENACLKSGAPLPKKAPASP